MHKNAVSPVASPFGQHLLHTIKHVKDTGTPQAIKNVFPTSFIGHKSGVFQDGQVSRQGGHVDVEHFEQGANVLFSVGEFLDNLQSRWMTECFEHF